MSLLSNPRFVNGIEGKLISAEDLDGKYLFLSSESTAWKYDQEEGVILETWFTKSFQKITQGLISCPDGSICLVLNDRRVLRWDGVDKNVTLDSLEPKLILNATPVDHFFNECQELFWVLSDGSLQSANKILFMYSQNTEVYAHFQAIFCDEDPDSPILHLKPRKGPKLIGSNINKSVYIPSQNQIILLHSDKLLISSFDTNSEQTINLPPSYSLAGASIAPLGSCHFVLTCKSPGDGYTLFLFNVSFGDPLILTHINVKTVTDPLKTSGNNIFIQHGPRVACVKANILPDSLAELIAIKDNVLETNDIMEFEPDSGEMNPMKLYELILPMLREGNVASIHKTLAETQPEDVPELLVLAILEVYFAYHDMFPTQEDFTKSVVKVISISITPSLMAPLLKKTEFSFAKDLLEFFDRILKEETEVECVFHWASLILDAHYLNFQLTRDQEGLEILNKMNETLGIYIMSEDVMLSTLPLMKLIGTKKMILPKDNFDRKNSSYFIDVIDI
ncbi:uncharacterized protein [Lepeophtheirus salmonis]|uniref:uncharacterized protein n=1 Tax=Lepeophtheirus salmonis TaxID=72036 RepID=UPI00077F0DC7|nr:uncharacterized protein LOC121122575 [Lepeophtheirus salmonis]